MAGSSWFPPLCFSNLTDSRIGGDIHRECFSCTSVSNRLKEIMLSKLCVIHSGRGLHDLGGRRDGITKGIEVGPAVPGECSKVSSTHE